MMGPLAVDQQIRGAVIQCWQMLRPEERSVEAVEQIILGVVRRVLDDLKEDAATFGFTPDADAAEDET